MATNWVHPMRWINQAQLVRISGLVGLLALAGCGNIPEVDEDRTMRAIYDRHVSGGAVAASPSSGEESGSPERMRAHARLAEDSTPPRMSRYTRSVATETENLFPRLPNPTLYLYVRPHTVGQDGLPIPGYTVPFKMYERDRHAMPGERLPSDSAPALPHSGLPSAPRLGDWYE